MMYRFHELENQTASSAISSKKHRGNRSDRERKVIAVGASTGGTDAIRDLLKGMPRNCPPILVVIHMPKEFTLRFGQRLNALCTINVKEV